MLVAHTTHLSLRGAKRRGNLPSPSVIARRDGFCPDEAISGAWGHWETRKRDCHGPLRGARNDDSQWVNFPHLSLRGARILGDEAISGTWGPQKRDCFAPLRGARNDDSQWVNFPHPSLRGTPLVIARSEATKQSLVPGDHSPPPNCHCEEGRFLP